MKTRQPNIKTIWFDLGNVLLFFDFTPAFQRVSKFSALSAAEIRNYFVKRPELEAHLDEGRLTGQTFYRMLRRDLRLRGLTYNHFKKIWCEIFHRNHPTIKLVGRLKRNGYRLILISNTNRLHFDYLRKQYPFLKAFDHVVLSFRLKARKPKRLIYQHAYTRSRALKDEIFYTDDRSELVAAAKDNMGVHAHTYRQFPALRSTLLKLGVQL